jgi:predicted RNA binding protein YcfA (HicA-like mRNA interferase family)
VFEGGEILSRRIGNVTYRELEAKLSKDGWTLDRQSGSHRIYVHETHKQVIVVSGHHGSEQVQKGMLSKISKQAGWK